METFEMDRYDIVVVGAGHAGCEAALASARMGRRTLLLSMNLEAVAMMPCNPSIGGSGKSHLVREIDALGGEMGLNIDKAFIQSRMLNTAKGPAVHSLRAQADKTLYHQEMKKTLEKQERLDLKQGEAVELLVEEGAVCGVVMRTGAVYRSRAVILATGTFLRGTVFMGQSAYSSGPNGMAPSVALADNLKAHGLKLRRFKTGTPARALGSSLDRNKMTEQPGDPEIVPFSFMNEELQREQVSCWLTYTNQRTHQVILENLERSALYGGLIKGIGPRYCPSIEDKVYRFADKERHQLFVEPEGLSTDEVYLQGMANSLPEDVQRKFYRTIPGLEQLRIVRSAYAIEYDCIDPLELQVDLQHRRIEGLFCAGQFNGSSGYEEAAAQGLMAGINAVRKLEGKEPFVLDRSQAYIGVLIDDLITKGITEPYRIMTSRAEYRLALRQDNADLRLTEKGYELGLATRERYERFLETRAAMEQEQKRLETTFVPPEAASAFLMSLGCEPAKAGASLAALLKRPEVTYEKLAAVDPERPPGLSRHVIEKVEIHVKYEGYIQKQLQQIERFKKLEDRKLPEDLAYEEIEGLRIEARQKLSQFRPLSLGQASRLSGVSPADVNVLLIYLEKQRRLRKG
ncbi:MAG: tRNA uridine-5-carboxymethylaminomethyl(34) synthesis enzyme MnmG [Bacillota bacterium]|nr:tRNA uridine-5-carboxymethylaminomethyl(34) synthesis enzyme MnmG [Bacillota bacterium]